MTAGLDKKGTEKMAVLLSQCLANLYTLQVKTQNFHWNLVDPRFHSLHAFFQEQYEKVFEFVDEVAERIRMLGHRAPGSMREFLDLGTLDEASGLSSGDEMLSELLIDHELIIKEIRGVIEEAQKVNDEGTADLLIALLRFHEKTVWMLHSHFFEG